MSGFSPKLPLTLDADDGYALNKNLRDVARQNFKALILTGPGERIMDPEFGVGIRNYLFENNIPSTYGQIETRIREQALKYLPYIQIDSIDFNAGDQDPTTSGNLLSLRISYVIKKLAIIDSLEIPIN